MSNSFGKNFRFTTFGESHGPAVGVVVDGCPAGVAFDPDLLTTALKRRRPGTAQTSSRNETDVPEVVSGVYDGQTLGSPIAVLVRNTDARSGDYDELKNLFRPSHGDFTYSTKYGVRDHRGGGRASARETLGRVAAGAIARMILQSSLQIAVRSAVVSMGEIMATADIEAADEQVIYASPVRCHDAAAEQQMIDCIARLREEGDSIGGVVETAVTGLPAGVGEPIYDKLESRLAAAMLSINACMGFEFGAGFDVARRRGSQNNDEWVGDSDGRLQTRTNNSGGIQAGISNGMPVRFRVPFKPPSSIAKSQTHGRTDGKTETFSIEGRHDPSIVVRAVPVVEAMTWIVLADLWLESRIHHSFLEEQSR